MLKNVKLDVAFAASTGRGGVLSVTASQFWRATLSIFQLFGAQLIRKPACPRHATTRYVWTTGRIRVQDTDFRKTSPAQEWQIARR